MNYKVKHYQYLSKPPMNIRVKVYEGGAGCALEGDADGKSIPIPKHVDLMVRFMVECEAQNCTLDMVHIVAPGSTSIAASVKRVP